MTSNLARYKTDLEKLIALGDRMYTDLAFRILSQRGKISKEDKEKHAAIDGAFENEYQSWYTEAFALIRQLIPDRLAEFQELYKGDGKRKTTGLETYHIQDWLNGIRAADSPGTKEKRFDDLTIVTMRLTTQIAIVKAVKARFESSLHDIQQLVRADLFDSELDAARELSKSGFLRAAGAIGGVVLEKHLGQVSQNHNVGTKKAHPTISELNDALKAANVLEVPAWRNIQRLGDLRNLCDHSKHRDPTQTEIDELVDGVEKVTKTLF